MPVPGGKIRIGIGGWVFPPWRETFYPPGTRPNDFLPYASRQFSSIEVNATFYRTQSVATYRAWYEATPEDFVFALKAPRAATAPRDPGRARVAVERFLSSGPSELGQKLGPIVWQIPSGRQFDAAELGGFVSCLPRETGGLSLRHAVEASHPSFDTEACAALLREQGIGRVLLDGAEPNGGGFVYARLKGTVPDEPAGYSPADLNAWASRIREWSRIGDCFVYIIAGAKQRNPGAARELTRRLRDMVD